MKLLLRFSDLRDRGIVNNRATLGRWIQQIGFPNGIKLGANTRVWTEEEIDEWIQARRELNTGNGEATDASAPDMSSSDRDRRAVTDAEPAVAAVGGRGEET